MPADLERLREANKNLARELIQHLESEACGLSVGEKRALLKRVRELQEEYLTPPPELGDSVDVHA